jgi:hypothetical protein
VKDALRRGEQFVGQMTELGRGDVGGSSHVELAAQGQLDAKGADLSGREVAGDQVEQRALEPVQRSIVDRGAPR